MTLASSLTQATGRSRITFGQPSRSIRLFQLPLQQEPSSPSISLTALLSLCIFPRRSSMRVVYRRGTHHSQESFSTSPQMLSAQQPSEQPSTQSLAALAFRAETLAIASHTGIPLRARAPTQTQTNSPSLIHSAVQQSSLG